MTGHKGPEPRPRRHVPAICLPWKELGFWSGGNMVLSVMLDKLHSLSES